MELIGELERAFATMLYPLRAPIAIAAVVLAVVAIRAARRGRWDLIARRNPIRALAVAIPLLVVGLPVGWYLASPLIIRTELIEPAPGLVAVDPRPSIAPPSIRPTDLPVPTETTAPVQATPPVGAAPSLQPEPSPAVTAFAPRTVASGTFTGADSFHFGRGTASLIEVGAGEYSLRFESFSVRNGPDLYVYVSPSTKGYTAAAIDLGRLKATDGAFNYALPAGIDLAAARSVVIWCKQFAVLFAIAPLKPS